MEKVLISFIKGSWYNCAVYFCIQGATMELNRLRWAARRGMLELDLILSPFVEREYALLNDAEKQQFERLLACEDQDLFNWFLNKTTSDDTDIQSIVQLVLERTKRAAIQALP